MVPKPGLGILGEKLVEAGVLHERIALCAYQRYEARGHVDGYDVQDWLQAEQEVISQLEQPAKSTAKKVPRILPVAR